MTDRVLKAPESEKQVVGSILLLPEIAPEIARIIRPEDMICPAMRVVYRAMETMRAEGLPIETPLLFDRIRNHPEFRDENLGAYLLPITHGVATAAHAVHYAKQIRETSLKRQQISALQGTIEHLQNGYTSTQGTAEIWASVEDWRRVAATDSPRFRIYSAKELDEATFDTTFDIERLLVSGEPLAVGAPEKHLKTSLMLAAGISLNIVDDFLGDFQVNRQRKFLMLSGESGVGTIQETARRICKCAGRELKSLEGFHISADLPQLDDLRDVVEFEAVVANYAPDIVAIDPMMLCLGDIDERAANMFSMGKLLRRLNEACQKNNATLMFAHHTSGVQQYGATPKLSWLAFSGFKQFARQWWLLNRMEEYEVGSGFHRLKFVAGGSAGHNGMWILEINEGSRNDPGGRRWEVVVKSVEEARESAEERKAEAKAEAEQKKLDAGRKAVCRLMARRPGASWSWIRDHCGVSSKIWPDIFATMFAAGELVECEINVANKKKPIIGYRLNTSEVA